MGIFGSLANFLNNLNHTEPISIVADLFFWLFVFCVGFPLAAIVALLRMVYQVLAFFFGSKNIDPRGKVDEELAVLVTGCDSGFGRELVEPLTARGFTVFCGCLQKQSFRHYKGNRLAHPIQLDVTSDTSVAAAHKSVLAWLAGGSRKSKTKQKRRFHSLVLNAGIVRVGPIDWAALSDFQACMDVNYYGIIRMVKEFIPVFKKQAFTGSYSDARIVNMVSMAGVFQGGDCLTPYGASKHAADALTNNLRLEMEAYGVQVSCISPTFHATPMSNPNTIGKSVTKLWDGLSTEKQEEYGEDFLREFRKVFDNLKYITWRSKNVTNAIEDCVVAKYPRRRVLVGIDAKYAFAPLNLLRAGIGISAVRGRPAIMKQQ